MKSFAAGLLWGAVALFAAMAGASAQGWDAGYYGPPPPVNYNFYGPTTNYFSGASSYDAPDDGGGYGQSAGYAPYYAPYYADGGTGMAPAEAYDDMRLDPWHGYNPNY